MKVDDDIVGCLGVVLLTAAAIGVMWTLVLIGRTW